MSDRTVIICMSVEQLQNPVEGSLIARCMECGVGLWVYPVMLSEQPQAEPMCVSCAGDLLIAPDAEFIPPSPAQIEELEREMKKRED